MARIVVGVDDSDGSHRALAWAAEEAALRGATLQVVHVYDPPQSWWAYSDDGGMTAATSEAVRDQLEEASELAKREADAFVARITEGIDVPIEATTVEATRPAPVLIGHSEGADLLVVGSRGRGGFSGLLLGSVSQQAAAHAHCPVVVVQADDA
ncbi:MAG: universal stress protein [Nitriliruptoraceae bacterium]